MEVQAIIDKRKDLYKYIISFIDCCDDITENWEQLKNYFDSKKELENKEELKEIIKIIHKITAHHYRDPLFFNKTKIIFSYLKEKIMQTFSNSEIINIFHNNKKILLQLLDMQIIYVDMQFIEMFPERLYNSFFKYFYPEIKAFFETKEEIDDENISIFDSIKSEIEKNVFDDFEKKRQEGENDSYICSLIRKDDVIEFISYVNKNNLPLSSSKITSSSYETNLYLLYKEPSLIEYAAFFGSIQIFQYLLRNKVELSSSIWNYAIHSNNPLLIHMLEENHIIPVFHYYTECYEESVKCHHNDIANYIKNNYSIKDIFLYGFRSHNYEQIPTDINKDKILYPLIKYDYLDLLKILLKTENIDFSEDIIDEIIIISIYAGFVFKYIVFLMIFYSILFNII